VTITGHVVFQQGDQSSEDRAGGTPPASRATLQCDELQVDSKRSIYVATGNVVYLQGSQRATALNGRLDQNAHALVLYGNVRLTDGEQMLSAQTIRYDTLTKKVLSSVNP
jgi:lipopolysaccharide assembly outer membrane protein LptD (OstA)